jgi:hypothetical protein
MTREPGQEGRNFQGIQEDKEEEQSKLKIKLQL